MALPVIVISSAVALAAPALAPAVTAAIVANVSNRVLSESETSDILTAIYSLRTAVSTGFSNHENAMETVIENASNLLRQNLGATIDGTWYDFGQLIELGYVGVREGHLHINIVPSDESQEHSERWWAGAE